MLSISEPFIRRPVGTTLLAIGLFLIGAVAYNFLPVAAVPNVDFPMIRVSATRPGADPTVMAGTVAAPLERRLGQIAGINQITSTSSLGATSIQLQFNIGRDIDRAARDVQAAINASLADLPSDLPSLPRFRKANPAAAPVFVLALTSKTISPSAIYDVADTVLAQRISQVPGLGEVTVTGADQPAVRISLNPVALSNAGIATDDVRIALLNANAIGPVGIFNGGRQSETLSINKQMRTAAEFRDILIKSAIGNLSLMALAISIGFVVDDAIVMIENMYRNLEHGMRPHQAALEGARQIGFTVLSISLSLIAAFTPLIFMDGIVGRLLREFSLTLTFAIVVSTVVSLTITPMICAHYIKATPSGTATWFDRLVEGSLSRMVAFYARTLQAVLGYPFLTLIV